MFNNFDPAVMSPVQFKMVIFIGRINYSLLDFDGSVRRNWNWAINIVTIC
jgi:hypothetical protein